MKVFSFVISLLLLLQSSGMEQEVLRLNDFIAHARYHHEQFGDSFWDFLEKHYAQDGTAHENQHQDQKDAHHNLPFHGENTHVQTFVCQLGGVVVSSEINPFFTETAEKSSFFYRNQYDLLKESVIFKPPC